jgi:hypothetical protein
VPSFLHGFVAAREHFVETADPVQSGRSGSEPDGRP